MQIKAGKILTAIMILSVVTTAAYGINNPLKSYDLYQDTHGDSERDNVMSDYYRNSLAGQRHQNQTSAVSNSTQASAPASSLTLPELPNANSSGSKGGEIRRNEYLRQSSKKVYGDSKTPAAWTKGPNFYPNPSLESIKLKYKKSNFAGCMQEAESYVKKHPNDTLGFYYLAMCYAKVNDKENAIKAYEKVISLNANPMIVKYATNGRNCVMGGGDTCYQNVNVPELIYPYANVAKTQNLTPVDPDTLIQRNLNNLYKNMASTPESGSGSSNGKDGKDGKVSLPFGNQDSALDEFINSPYGTGLAPELNKEYKGQQLKKIQETINNNGNNIDLNIENIRKFDKSK
jgi:tetratricopeptide (TPR) repeat protein